MELNTTRGGKWSQTKGGTRNHCQVGQHMTTAPGWAWYHDGQQLVRTAWVCDSCAKKEADRAAS